MDFRHHYLSVQTNNNFNESKLTHCHLQQKLQSFTCSLLSIRQAWRDDDPPPLSNADSQQSLVHAWNHIPHPNVRVVCAIPLVAGTDKKGTLLL